MIEIKNSVEGLGSKVEKTFQSLFPNNGEKIKRLVEEFQRYEWQEKWAK